MKIGFVIYGSLDTISGGYLYDRKLVEYLRSKGDQVDIISIPWRNYLFHLSDNLSFRLPGGYDILIEDELNHPSLLAANAGKRTFPVISLVHHLRSSEQYPRLEREFYRAIETNYLHSVDGFIFNSDTTRKVVTTIVGPGTQSVLAYPPTDRFGTAISSEFVQARSFSNNGLRIVFLGNVIPRKGLSTIIEAMHKLKEKITLNVIGSMSVDPAYAEKMRQMTIDYGLGEKITFHGALDQTGIEPVLRHSNLMVVPSSYEGFGMVYLEGMCFGLPAVGSTLGAAGEIIETGKTGYLITPGDSEGLSEILNKMVEDRLLLNELSQNSLLRYAMQPTWQHTAGEIHQFLFRMISSWKN